MKHRNRSVVLQRKNIDVAQLHELTPGPIGRQEFRHTRHGPDTNPFRTLRLSPEVHQACVMPHMSMGEEDRGGLRHA